MIQIFDADGSYISSITHITPEEKLKEPVCVAVGPDDWVYVVEMSCHRVSVFDKDHKFVKSFGTKGDKDEEFCAPYGIGVSQDGYIRLCQ